VAHNVHGLLLCWYSVIRSARTEADQCFAVEVKYKS